MAIRKVLTRILVSFFAVVVLVPFASATFLQVSEASELQGTADNLSCVDFLCDDSSFTANIQHYSELVDGSTTSGINIYDKTAGVGENQDRAGRIVFDLPLGVVPSSNYTVRIFWRGGFPTNLTIVPYNTSKSVFNNVSKVVELTSEGWKDIDITEIVKVSTDASQGRRVRLRLFASESSDTNRITEAFLLDPATNDFQILDTGVTTTAATDTTIEHRWKVVSGFNFNVTNIICSVYDVANDTNINSSVTELWDNDNQVVVARWTPNSSVVQEKDNYRISCNADVKVAETVLEIDEFSQFVYISAEKTILDTVIDILNNVLSILGIVQENRVQINATRDIANETRDIVRELNETGSGATIFEIGDMEKFIGQDIKVSGVLSDNDGFVNDASCDVTVRYPNLSVWVSSSMSALGSDGIYSYDDTLPQTPGDYRLTSNCSGGSLDIPTRSSATIFVSRGVRMSSIS